MANSPTRKKDIVIKAAISGVSVFTLIFLALFCFSWSSSAHEVGPAIAITTRQPQVLGVATEAAAVPLQQKTTTLVAVGDIMLSRNVEQKMTSKNDWLYPFRALQKITSAADITFGNLESPIIAGPIVVTGQMTFRADPKAVLGLNFGGFDVLSLANNHMKNKSDAGISATIQTLDKAGVKHAGAGTNDVAARQPAIIAKNGIRFGFLAYLDSSFSPKTYEATPTRSGSPFMSQAVLKDDINKLKGKADVIIVSMHAGTEYAAKPNQKQKDFARLAIDLGAKLVIGHHPHVIEPVEKYHGGYILYSLGNFVFDQMWSQPTRDSVIATVTFTGTTPTGLKLTPAIIYDFAQPRLATGSDINRILAETK